MVYNLYTMILEKVSPGGIHLWIGHFNRYFLWRENPADPPGIFFTVRSCSGIKNTKVYEKTGLMRIMRQIYFAIFSLLVLVAAGFSGCTGSPGSAGTSDRDVILQGIASGEQYCINHLSTGVSTDKCRVTTTNTELIITRITADAKAHEQTCLQNIRRSDSASACPVPPAALEAAAERSAICIDNYGNNNVDAVKSCVDTAFAAVT